MEEGANIVFTYNGKETNIECKKDEKIIEICKRFAAKMKIEIGEIFFQYNGNKIKENLNFIQHSNEDDKKRNIMNILVYENNEKKLIID